MQHADFVHFVIIVSPLPSLNHEASVLDIWVQLNLDLEPKLARLYQASLLTHRNIQCVHKHDDCCNFDHK